MHNCITNPPVVEKSSDTVRYARRTREGEVAFSKGQELNSSCEILRRGCFGHQIEVAHALADRAPELMSVDDAGKERTCHLASFCLGEEVIILREEWAAELRRPVEKVRVLNSCAAVLLRRDDLDSSQPQAEGDRAWNVLVEVKG